MLNYAMSYDRSTHFQTFTISKNHNLIPQSSFKFTENTVHIESFRVNFELRSYVSCDPLTTVTVQLHRFFKITGKTIINIHSVNLVCANVTWLRSGQPSSQSPHQGGATIQLTHDEPRPFFLHLRIHCAKFHIKPISW